MRLFLILILSLGMYLHAEMPVDYYDSARGKIGSDLKAALHDIIDNNIETNYDASSTGARGQMYAYFDNHSNTVTCVYTGFAVAHTYGTFTAPADINCEHTYCQSWFEDISEQSIAKADIHHLFPVKVSVNSSRNNLPLDNVSSIAYTYHVAGDYYSYRGTNTQGKTVFEPADIHKGDAARAMLYFSVRYEMGLTQGEVDMLSTLLEWHEDDPVSTEEINRNDNIHDYQENRNPFIDHPEYADQIWGDQQYSIIITEIIQNPADVTDANGEWFEIYNYGSYTINIDGWIIKDNDSESHTIDNGGTLNITAGDFLVLGVNSTSGENGNYICDYQYSSFFLANGDDEIILMNGDVEVDRIEYDGGTNWPDPTGASMVFTGSVTDDNNDGSKWTTASVRQQSFVVEAGDDKGSPGSSGDDQALPVELVDFFVQFDYDQPTLFWTTESEEDNLGWNIFRSELQTGFETGSYQSININLIPGMGNSTEPVSYSFIDEYPVVEGNQYWYWLQSVSTSQEYENFGPVQLMIPILGETPPSPEMTNLYQNYPNPFNPQTVIRFDVAADENGVLTIFNIKGQIVYKNLFHPGQHQITWQAEAETSGIYYYKLDSPTLNVTRKMLLLK